MQHTNQANSQPADADAVVTYWFGGREIDGRPANRRWFGSIKAVDADISNRFAFRVAEALDGGNTDWEATPHGRLALILLLDQFPRNMFRGTARAFAGDARARQLTVAALDANDHHQFGIAECGFLYMPLQHSESLQDQQQSVALTQALRDNAAPGSRRLAAGFLRSAKTHHDIIVRFGRFPHRNAILKRTSTAAETAYLTDAPRFGQ